MRKTLFAFALAVAVALTLLATASGNNGIGPVPPAPDSSAVLFGGAPASNGVTPTVGEISVVFDKGNESYHSNGTTTVVDFTLPAGVTIHTDPECAGGIAGDDFCLDIDENGCSAAPTGVTVNGNEIEFQIACAPGGFFIWFAEVDSLLPEGNYDVSTQFKVATYKRTKDAPNMWQIKMPGEFGAFGCC